MSSTSSDRFKRYLLLCSAHTANTLEKLSLELLIPLAEGKEAPLYIPSELDETDELLLGEFISDEFHRAAIAVLENRTLLRTRMKDQILAGDHFRWLKKKFNAAYGSWREQVLEKFPQLESGYHKLGFTPTIDPAEPWVKAIKDSFG